MSGRVLKKGERMRRFQVVCVASVGLVCGLATTAQAQAPASAEVKEGIDWLAIPLMKFNDDAGFVYGVKVEVVDFQKDRSPYAWNLEVKLLHSTTNRHEHRIVYDAPGLAGSDWRLKVRAEFLHIDDASFFGLGNGSVNTGDPAFHRFKLTEPRLKVLASRPLWGRVFVAGGLIANLTLIEAPPGSALARQAPLGSEGGFGLAGLLSLGYDSRDNELVPTEGIFAEVYLRGSSEALGSDFGFIALGATAQLYLAPISWLVLAERVMVEHLAGSAPFYEQQRLGGSADFLALGGVFSQRGFIEGRFGGATKLLSNTEARVLFPPAWESLFLGLGAFADVSRVLDGGVLTEGFHPSGGGAFYINWDNAFVFRIEQGFSKEGSLFYIEGRYLF